jgi:hypothetical protein
MDPKNLLDKLSDEVSPQKNAAQAAQIAQKKKKLAAFSDPLTQLTPKERQKAVGSHKMTGNFVQRTLRLPPEYLELIQQVAKREIIPMAEAERWLMWRGLEAYFQDGEKPEFTQETKRMTVTPHPARKNE